MSLRARKATLEPSGDRTGLPMPTTSCSRELSKSRRFLVYFGVTSWTAAVNPTVLTEFEPVRRILILPSEV